MLLLVLFVALAAQNTDAQDNFQAQREAMIRAQLKGRDISDSRTLKAMLKVPRHEFVPEKMRPYAYFDRPLPIGSGQTISQPYIVAFMTQSLALTTDARVLEIGTGSGYQAAILAEIVDSVYTIEIVEELGIKARKLLRSSGYDNVKVKIGDGYHGWPDKAPFDAIMVTAGADSIPAPLIAQLKEGGRMIIPVGPHGGVRQLILGRKKGNRLKTKAVMPVRFVPFVRKKE